MKSSNSSRYLDYTILTFLLLFPVFVYPKILKCQCVCVHTKLLRPCLTLSDPMGCSPQEY